MVGNDVWNVWLRLADSAAAPPDGPLFWADVDMNKDGGGMGAGDMVVYQPVSLYTLQGRKVGQRGVFTSIISGQPGAATSMAYSTVNLYFGGGNAIYETLYAPGHFNASVPLKDGEVWRRAIRGTTSHP